MLLTTTAKIEGFPATQYLGLVFGEAIVGINVFKDFAASVRNLVGGRTASYENELINARQQALAELEQRAAALGAEAVVGIDIDYEAMGADNGMIMVTVSGTAIRVSPIG